MLKVAEEEVGSGAGSGFVSQRTDPRIRIHTKMSQIPNTTQKGRKNTHP
jgi:hypothetical protein